MQITFDSSESSEKSMNPFVKFALSVSAICLLAVTQIGGCTGSSGGSVSNSSDVRYVNMATDVKMNPTRASFDSFDFGTVAQYAASPLTVMTPTTQGFFIDDKDGVNVYVNANEGITANSRFDIIAVGNSSTSVGLVKIWEIKGSSMPGAGEVRLKFVNGYDTQAVDVYVVPAGNAVAGAPDVANLLYGGAFTETRSITGSHDFVACTPGTTTELFRTNINLVGGNVYLSILVKPTALAGSFKNLNFYP